MLNYPLNWNYSVDIMKNDLELYELLMTERTPAMTWSWFTIGFKWVGEHSKTTSYFLKSYQDYIIQPFQVTTYFTLSTPLNPEIFGRKICICCREFALFLIGHFILSHAVCISLVLISIQHLCCYILSNKFH